MKKMLVAVVLTVLLASALSSVAYAAAGGTPGAHGVDGKTFGGLVSARAQDYPGALAEHTSGGRAGGMPALHGVDGMTFGSLVSGLAQMYPGAVADHVK